MERDASLIAVSSPQWYKDKSCLLLLTRHSTCVGDWSSCPAPRAVAFAEQHRFRKDRSSSKMEEVKEYNKSTGQIDIVITSVPSRKQRGLAKKKLLGRIGSRSMRQLATATAAARQKL